MSQYTTPVSVNDEDEIDLAELFKVIQSKWKLILIALVVFAIGGYIIANLLPNRYLTKTTILIEENTQKDPFSQLQGIESLDIFSGFSSDFLQNEIEILKSRRILGNVVDSLDLIVAYLHDDTFVQIPLQPRAVPFKVEVGYLSLINTDVDPNLSIRLNRDGTSFTLYSEEGERTFDLNTRIELGFCEITVTENPLFRTNGDKAYFTTYEVLLRRRSDVIDELIKNVGVSIVENSSVLAISMENTSVEISEEILNSMVVFYNKNAIKNKNAISLNTARFIEKRLRIISQELDSVERSKVDFKSTNKLTDIAFQAEQFVEHISETKKKELETLTK
ncbi:Wzz/FepE/Etk N-terminal domain-containing protein [Galbibacter sp.]|uniref:Wzz/FepE/Etk N-terminal domain-containing protein n=1 Tax=Galbibacter sp. TaxID=2918471 RepID=UPI003A9457E0